MTRPIPIDLLDPFMIQWEARRKKAYLDSAGIWTIGIGHTGPEVRQGLVWTDGEIDAAFHADMEEAARDLPLKEDVVARLTEGQYAACLSFVFNAGPNPGATLWKKIRAGKMDEAANEFGKWKYATDPVTKEKFVVAGLVNRRAAEVHELWMHAEEKAVLTSTSSPAVVVSTGAPKASRSASIWAGVTGAITTGPAVIKGVIEQIAPWAHYSEYLAKAIAALGIVGAALAVFSLTRFVQKTMEASK